MKSLRMLMGVILLVTGLGLSAIGVRMLLQRNEYASTATISTYQPPLVNDNSYDPYFILTEFQTVQSHEVLTKVTKALDLNDFWGKKYNHGERMSDSEVEDMLKSKLDLQMVRNTALMRIKVFDDDPTEAAKLANAIAQSYCKYRGQEFQSRSQQRAVSKELLTSHTAEIVDTAVAELRAVRPNRYLAAVLLGCGVFLMMGGIICLNISEVEDPGNRSSG